MHKDILERIAKSLELKFSHHKPLLQKCAEAIKYRDDEIQRLRAFIESQTKGEE